MRRVAIGPIVAILIATLTSTIGASGVDGSYTCSSTSACFSAAQSAPSGSSGAGFHGTGVNGPGVRGNSTNAAGTLGQSASGSMLYPGVEGESTNNNGSDVAGAFGLTGISGTAPAYGVYALGGTGVYGQTTVYTDGGNYNTGNGIFGNDMTNSSGEYFNYDAGVWGASLNGIGVKATIGKQQEEIAFKNGVALEAYNFNNNGIGAYIRNSSNSLTIADGNDNYLLEDYNSYFLVDNLGNETLNGELRAAKVMTSSGTYARTRGASGAEKIAYGARTTAPSIEDVGGGQLVQGTAYVRLDSDLADVIDRRLEYRVFITPEGDCKGLYVTGKSPSGFMVRELQGGRSNIAFDYRIVAKPFDEDGRRLAAAPIESPSTIAASHTGMRRTFLSDSRSIDPLEELKQRLGPAKFAAALAEFKRQQRR